MERFIVVCDVYDVNTNGDEARAEEGRFTSRPPGDE